MQHYPKNTLEKKVRLFYGGSQHLIITRNNKFYCSILRYESLFIKLVSNYGPKQNIKVQKINNTFLMRNFLKYFKSIQINSAVEKKTITSFLKHIEK